MKKLLLALAVLTIPAFQTAKAQDTIPNPSFETWTDDAFAGWPVKDPNLGSGTTGWWDYNFFNSASVGASPVTVFQDSANPSPYSGKYCARIVSDTLTATSYEFLESFGYNYPDKTVGLLFAGNINLSTESFKVGFPFSARLTSFSFYYQYIPNGKDSCFCEIGVYHWNSVTNSRDTLGGGEWWQNTATTAWTQATVPMVYNPDSALVTPDTIDIEFSACSLLSSPKMYDTMNIDYAGVVTAINNVTSNADKMSVYPNPATDEINLKVTGQIMANQVEIYNVTGQMVGAYSIRNNFLTINTQSYSSGIYLYKLLDDNGAQLSVGKFDVAK